MGVPVSDDSGYPLDDPKHPANAGASKGLRESLVTSGLRRGDRVRDVKTGRTGSVIHQQKSNWQDGTLVMVRLDGDDPTVNPLVRWAADLDLITRNPARQERRG